MDEIREDTPATALPPTAGLTGRKRRRFYKKQARAEGAAYLRERSACDSAEDRKAFRKKWKARKKDWKLSLKSLDEDEQRDQKKAYKAFRARIHRMRRIIAWVLILAMLTGAGVLIFPAAKMNWKVRQSQQFTDGTVDAEIARANGYLAARAIADEGIVLLQNDNDLLPLQDTKLNVFGDDAYTFVDDSSIGSTEKLTGALTAAGIAVNPVLDETYRSLTAQGNLFSRVAGKVTALVKRESEEKDWSLLPGSDIAAAKEYSGTALIVLSASSEDGSDLSLAQLQPASDGTNQAAMLERVCKEFEHVILVINSANVMELGFVKDYPSIEAVLWVGEPGALGSGELAKVLTGEVNPSGRTVDTWPVSLADAPAYATYGSNYYANLSDLHVLNYSEGIYVGYRYYETRYGADENAYADAVVYPFGSGLSYTRFSETISSFMVEDDTVTVEVTVKNLGKVDGKDVVELYFMAPWDGSDGVETPAIELAAFAKTDVLAPRESTSVTLSFPVRDMSSWDSAAGSYLLRAGDYRIAIGKDVHAALTSPAAKVYTVEEPVRYETDETTGTALENRFAFASASGAESETLTTLSRADWEDTWPAAEDRPVASAELKEAKAAYETSTGDAADANLPTLGAANGIQLANLKGLDWDDPQWDAFLDQFTADELVSLAANGAWHTEAIDRLGIPSALLLDGTSGLRSRYATLRAVSYPCATMLGATWNTALSQQYGDAVALEASAYGVSGWYAPGANIRRLACSGTNRDSYAEDPLLAGKMAAAAVQSAQGSGLLVFVKDLGCGETALNERNNLTVWVSEQALREIYLRPFEIAVKEGGAAGIQTAYTRLGVQWCGASSALLQEVLRGEWGFDGVITSEICVGSWMNAALAIRNGGTLMRDAGASLSETVLKRSGDGMLQSLRESAHALCYALVNRTNLF